MIWVTASSLPARIGSQDRAAPIEAAGCQPRPACLESPTWDLHGIPSDLLWSEDDVFYDDFVPSWQRQGKTGVRQNDLMPVPGAATRTSRFAWLAV